MSKTNRYVVLVAVALGLVALSAGIAVAAGGGDETTTPAAVSDEGPAPDDGATEPNDDTKEGQDGDASLTGASADKAAEAALATTGGGTVLAVESDDGGAGYEVEIRKSDGSEAEVELDESFAVTQRLEDD